MIGGHVDVYGGGYEGWGGGELAMEWQAEVDAYGMEDEWWGK